ncbi:hypothetical protein EIK77_001374 [Talaromyces pinophilus]|nr:hypothetical protein EIK77_001374 [Talaromyces pinophilus]
MRPIPFDKGIFWANSGLGLASVPDFWKTFHAGDVKVHRTEIASYSDTDKVHLKNGVTVGTDYVILCTGWSDALEPFNERLRVQCGLLSKADFTEKWKKLDAEADDIVSKKLPILANPPDTFVETTSQRRPWRLYRRLISPKMAAVGDRSIFFPGQIHSVYTPLVAEMQALWGVAYLLCQLEVPNQDDMEKEIAVWNAWTRKRYLEQGRKHAYSIYDYLAVSFFRSSIFPLTLIAPVISIVLPANTDTYVDTLARDLGINTSRKANPIAEMFSTYVPSDYNVLIGEYLHNRERKAELAGEKSSTNGHANGKTNGAVNGKTNRYTNGHTDGKTR